MSTLRRRIASALPASMVVPARRLVRIADQVIGLPLSPWRPGAIAMFHMGRSGSTVFGNLLDQHPLVRWDGEVYWRKWRQFGFELLPFDTRSFLRRQMLVAGRRFYGFEMKIHPDQEFALAHRTIGEHVAQLEELGFTHYIVLERKNYLRRMISQIAGAITQTRFVSQGEKPRLTKFHLDLERVSFGVVDNPRSLLACFKEIEGAYRRLRSLLEGKRVLEISYEEDILPDPRLAYRRACEFLGIQARDVQVQYKRTNPFPIEEMIENYSELEAQLRGSEYEWMLSD